MSQLLKYFDIKLIKKVSMHEIDILFEWNRKTIQEVKWSVVVC